VAAWYRFFETYMASVMSINNVGTFSLLENWIEEAERRARFLFETTRVSQ
jgi:hypothetical protein